MKKPAIIIIIVLILIIIFSFIFLYPRQNPGQKTQDKNNFSSVLSDTGLSENKTQISAGSQGSLNQGTSGGGGGTGGGGNTGSTENPAQKKQLPSDINTTDCGFYFVEYGICAGTCPLGTCKSEGRSCYCQS